VNNGENIRFEEGRKEHVNVILSMMQALDDVDPGPTPFDGEGRRRNWERFVGDGLFGKAWIICDGTKPMGYVVLTLGFSFECGGRDGFVDELFVDEKYRGRGIGRRTMEFVEQRAREMGVKALHLEATRENEAAIELYRQAGYMRHERFLMTKRLGPVKQKKKEKA
jgi:diamine N-acetyltransferase